MKQLCNKLIAFYISKLGKVHIEEIHEKIFFLQKKIFFKLDWIIHGAFYLKKTNSRLKTISFSLLHNLNDNCIYKILVNAKYYIKPQNLVGNSECRIRNIRKQAKFLTIYLHHCSKIPVSYQRHNGGKHKCNDNPIDSSGHSRLW